MIAIRVTERGQRSHTLSTADFSRSPQAAPFSRLRTRPKHPHSVVPAFLSRMLFTVSHFAQVPTFWKSLASQVISKILKVLPSLHLTLFLFPGGREDRVQPWRGSVSTPSSSFITAFLQGERGQRLRMKDSPPCPLAAEALIHFSWPLAVTKAAAFSLVSVLHAISQS